jgi:4-hydroxy-tetrahydrodipicolinate synthase
MPQNSLKENNKMKKSTLPRPLKGIIPPMITPLLDRDNIDVKGLEKLVEHILDGGVHGLFILGTTGEAPSLSYKLRYELIERVCKLVNNRIPVLVGITDTSHIESIKIAEHSQKQGVSAVVLAPPYYFQAGQPELLEYIEHLAPKLPLPLFLYNMPSCTKVFFDPETVVKASQIPNIHGIKDSSANMIYFHKLQLLLKDRKILLSSSALKSFLPKQYCLAATAASAAVPTYSRNYLLICITHLSPAKLKKFVICTIRLCG